MPREKELFRDNLVRLDERFPRQEMLSKKQVMEFTGLTYRTIDKHITFNDNRISKVKLASQLS